MRHDRTVSRALTLRLISLLPLFMTIAAAKAGYISNTASLPVLGVPYTSTTSAGCFAAAGVCVTSGNLTFDSVTSATFNASGQDIVSNVTYVGALTTIANTPIGSITLTGTVEQEVLGRTTSTETGTWTTDLLLLSLGGPLMGHTLTLALDPSQTSSGTTSITPFGTGTFLINSFFDVFVELELDSNPPLSTDRGPIQLTLSSVAAVPEPSAWAMMILGFAGIGAVSYRRRLAARTKSTAFNFIE
jgi:hypothetical protein